MKNNKLSWYMTILSMAAVFCLAMTIGQVGATSTRLEPESGYATHDYTMDQETGAEATGYSGGLDLVHKQIADSPMPMARCYLKTEDFNTGDGFRLKLFDYLGGLNTTIYTESGNGSYGSFAGCAKMNPAGDKAWFSKSGTTDAWYSVTCNSDLTTFGTAVQTYVQPAAWEVEWDTSGRAFFAGKESDPWNDPHAIFIRNAADNAWLNVVEIGGSSNGFAFDSSGNLWCGGYSTGGGVNYIYVFSASDVANKVTELLSDPNASPLVPGDADSAIPCPTCTDNSTTPPTIHKTGPNDIECDPDGNVYVSLNGGFYEDPEHPEINSHDAGLIVKYPNTGAAPWPTDAGKVILAWTHQNTGWDWQKNLSFDGATNLPGDDNRLYVDQDFGWGTGGPDQVTGITNDNDDDGDGVPDAVDNASATINPDQIDVDLDTYGNMCDADFDNNGIVRIDDFNMMKSVWGSSDNVIDMDSDGVIGIGDFNLLNGRWGDSAPYY